MEGEDKYLRFLLGVEKACPILYTEWGRKSTAIATDSVII